jgi:hypothetical protein
MANIVFLHYIWEDNGLWLVSDAGTGRLGPGKPVSATELSNSKAILYCAQTTSWSGNTAQVTWAISFKSAYVGTRNLYLCVRDQAGLTEGTVNKGTWTIY